MCIDDRWVAYCFDNACTEFGRAIEGELASVEGKNKKEISVKSDRVLRKMLGLPQQYRDPARSGHVAMPSKPKDE